MLQIYALMVLSETSEIILKDTFFFLVLKDIFLNSKEEERVNYLL